MSILNKIKEVVREINECEDVKSGSKLKVDLGLDSLSLVSVIVKLEDKLGIAFDDSDLDPSKLITVKDLVNLVEKTL